jgi:hypothetical protein
MLFSSVKMCDGSSCGEIVYVMIVHEMISRKGFNELVERLAVQLLIMAENIRRNV